MKFQLSDIAKLQSGLFAQPDIQADTLYLQGVHFDEFGHFDTDVKPQLKSDSKIERHLLQENDILFAAKGLNNFAVVYKRSTGQAVASSSFIIVRLPDDEHPEVVPEYLAWYLSHHPEVKLFHKQLGTTIPSISISKLGTLEVDIPTIEQQNRIVAIQQLRNQEKQLVRELEQKKDNFIKHQLLTATKQ